MKISFITTCKGRTFHLKETYVSNINNALNDIALVEFVLVNYDSPDDMDEWVTEVLGDYINSGVVTYVKIKEKKKYSHPQATNIGYRNAKGDILVTLEADNFFETGFVNHIVEIFSNQKIGFAWFPIFIKGATSRIAIKKECFEKVNGYNESLYGWGYDDLDLRERLLMLSGYELGYLNPFYGGVIEHEDIYRRQFNEYGFLPLWVTNFLNLIKAKLQSRKTYVANKD